MSGLDAERCLTCSDEAGEGVVVTVDATEAIVCVAGNDERIAIDLVPDAAPGDLLLCHAGIALQRLERAPLSSHVVQSRNVVQAPHGRGATG